MDQDVEKRAMPKLLALMIKRDEDVLWWGNPMQGLTIKYGQTVVMALLSGFILYSYYHDNKAPMDEGFLFGFILVGGSGLWALFMDSRRRKKTYYAVTTQRILFLEPDDLMWQTPLTMNLLELPDLILKEHGSGLGTIYFGVPALIKVRGEKDKPAFNSIANARMVYDLIGRAAIAAKLKR